MGKLKGKTAVITGGAQGIGKAICERLAKEGADIVVWDLNYDQAKTVADDLSRQGIRTAAIKGDVADLESVQKNIDEIINKFSRIDILVNNAGIALFNDLLSIKEKEFDISFEVNVKGMFFTLQAAAKYMVKQGGGKIINMSSQAGRRGEALALTYCMTKAAVISLTQSAGLELAPYRINVNAVAPGIIETPLWVSVDKQFAQLENIPIGEFKQRSVDAIPLGYIGMPEDVASVVAFLASSDADYMTCQTINVDGGNQMN